MFSNDLKEAVDACLQLSPAGDCSTGKDGPIGNWDVSRVTDMQAMFAGAELFNQDISKWDVSSVTDMAMLFNGTKSFNGDISKWDVSRVTDMSRMFNDAKSFNIDIYKWDVSRVANMTYMFKNAQSFNQTLCGEAWVSSEATQTDMFDGSLGSICGLRSMIATI